MDMVENMQLLGPTSNPGFVGGELKHMKKIMRVVAWGARTVMREYARLRDSEGKVDKANLRETEMNEHMVETSNDSGGKPNYSQKE